MSQYYIVEFEDGVQLVPKTWVLHETKQSYWPKFTKQMEINNAIAQHTKPLPDWPTHDLKRILGTADTYKTGMEKLRMAEKYSDLDSNSDFENNKKKRQHRARKPKLSTDDDEPVDESQSMIQKFPNPPKPVNIRDNKSSSKFVNEEDKSCRNKQNILSHGHRENDLSFPTNSSVESQNVGTPVLETETIAILKLILKKVNKLSCQIEVLMNEVEALKQDKSKLYDEEEDNIEFAFPVKTLTLLTELENNLKDQVYFNKLITFLKRIGKGKTIVDATTTVLKRVITNELALHFTFAGHRKGKECFKELVLHKVILKVLHIHYPESSEQQINKAVEMWLIQANLRRTREVNKQHKEAENIL